MWAYRRLTGPYRIEVAEWIGALRFHLRYDDDDGAAGVVDLAPEVGDEPGMLAVIRDRPGDVTVAPRGRALLWLTDSGAEVDLCADALRLLLHADQAAAE